jgi:hypothetical protein
MGHYIWGSLGALEVVLQFYLLPGVGHCERKKYTLKKIVHNLDILLSLPVFGYVWGALRVYLWENVYCFCYIKSSLVVNLNNAQFVAFFCINLVLIHVGTLKGLMILINPNDPKCNLCEHYPCLLKIFWLLWKPHT